MSYCTNCGQKIDENINFCPNCGVKKQNLKISNEKDIEYDKYQDNNSIRTSEILKSEALKKITDSSAGFFDIIFRAIGVIGVFLLGLLFLIPIITDNNFIIHSAYENGKSGNSAAFFGEIFLIYFPLYLIYIGYSNNSYIKTSVIILAVGLTIYTLSLFS